MIFTTTVVNAHALSHLFENDFSSIEHCDTCDEYVLSTQDDVYFVSPNLKVSNTQIVELLENTSISFFKGIPVISYHTGKYYNKPPPFKLV